MIIGCLGPEGASKSAVMTALTGIHYEKGGGQCYAFPGYHVYTAPDENDEQYYITKTVKVQDWLKILDNNEQQSELWDGALIDIDEIQQFFPAELWQLVSQRLFGYVATQRRKRGLTIIYTCMQNNWVNNRLRDLTHLQIHCWDMFWSPHMRSQGIERGQMSVLNFWDNKGFFRGIPGAHIGQMKFNTRKCWPCFESYTPIDVWEAMTKVRIKGKPEVEVEIGNATTNPYLPDLTPPAESLPINEILQGRYNDFQPIGA